MAGPPDTGTHAEDAGSTSGNGQAGASPTVAGDPTTTAGTTAGTATATIATAPQRTVTAASRTALAALVRRDLAVLRKNFGEFVARTLVQPFLLVFTFLYVFPTIGQGVGGNAGGAGPEFATVLVPGVVGIAIMFQGVQAAAMVMAQEFGFTREIEPRNIGLMFGFVVLPVTFLGGTYYLWDSLESVQLGGVPWLQALVLVNPLIYVDEGMRGAFTQAEHMHLYVIYPVAIVFCALLIAEGLRGFRRRVLS